MILIFLSGTLEAYRTMNTRSLSRTLVTFTCLGICCHLSNLNAEADEISLSPENNATENTDTFQTRPKKTDPTSEKIIQNFLEVSGGESAYAGIKTVKATGTIVEARRSKTFELIETHRGQRHLTYSWKHLGRNYKVVYAYDGTYAWKQELLPKEKRPELLHGLTAEHFAQQNWLIQPLVVPLRDSFVFKYQGKSKVSGRAAYLVTGFGKENKQSWFYFDQETFLLTRWGGMSELAGMEEYIDYRATEFSRVNDVLLPKKIDILAENSKFGTITLETITANQDVDPAIFECPKSKIQILRQVIKSNNQNQ